MRMTTEARDYVAMAAGLRRRMLQHFTQLRRRLLRELAGKLDCRLQVFELLRMAQGHKEKSLFPRNMESRVVTNLDSF